MSNRQFREFATYHFIAFAQYEDGNGKSYLGYERPLLVRGSVLEKCEETCR